MCEALGMALAIGSTLFSAYNQYQQGAAAAKSAKITAESNRAIAERNAQISEESARLKREAAADSMNRGASDAAVIRENARRANARARAVAASKGLLADEGSNLEVQVQNTQTGEINALTAMNNAEREAYGYKLDEYSLLEDAKSLRFTGDMGVRNAQYEAAVQKQAGLLNATSTLVTGGSKFYDSYYGQSKNSIDYSKRRKPVGNP